MRESCSVDVLLYPFVLWIDDLAELAELAYQSNPASAVGTEVIGQTPSLLPHSTYSTEGGFQWVLYTLVRQ